MKPKDYLPQAYASLAGWLTRFMTYVTANRTRFNISLSVIEALQVSVNQFLTAHTKAEYPNAGKADRTDRRDRAATVSRAARRFVNVNLRYNEAVTDEDRVNLQLVIPDTTPLAPHEPATIPVVTRLDSSLIMWIILHYKDRGSTSRAKPRGMHGVNIYWCISDEPPAKMSDLSQYVFSRRSPCKFEFDYSQHGKRVWFCLCWINMAGQKGPRSPFYSAIIP
jgi:hypothetical protein